MYIYKYTYVHTHTHTYIYIHKQVVALPRDCLEPNSPAKLCGEVSSRMVKDLSSCKTKQAKFALRKDICMYMYRPNSHYVRIYACTCIGQIRTT